MVHGNQISEKRQRLLTMAEVSPYIASTTIVAIAKERTEGLALVFLRTDHGHAFVQDLEILAESAYMQGVNDILDVIAGKKWDTEEHTGGTPVPQGPEIVIPCPS